jgi:hypothetical protein
MTTTIEKKPEVSTMLEPTKPGVKNGYATMKGLVYDGPGKIALKVIPKPVIEN